MPNAKQYTVTVGGQAVTLEVSSGGAWELSIRR
jgi:hypothetical protein